MHIIICPRVFYSDHVIPYNTFLELIKEFLQINLKCDIIDVYNNTKIANEMRSKISKSNSKKDDISNKIIKAY